MQNTGNNRGVSIIAAIFIIVILAFMGVMFLSLINTGSLTSVNDLQAVQALHVAEGGLEYILNFATFPNFSMGGALKSLGTGSFTITTPAILTAPTSLNGNGAINVNSTAAFPASGRIVIDAEIIQYTGVNAGTQFTGITRAQGGTTAIVHPSGNAVYPVTSTRSNLNNNCTTNTVNVNNTNGFLIPGIISIGTELIYCTGTNAGPSFTGCTRCYLGSAGAGHANPSNVYQYIINSTGIVGNARRTVIAGISNIANAAVAYDNRANPPGVANATTLNWSHTVNGARGNRMLIVGVSLYSIPTPTVLSVTYNTIPLINLNSRNGTNVRVEQWGLLNPDGGANQVVVTLSGNATLAVGGSISLYNVDQANALDVSAIDSAGTTTNPSLWITTATRNDMLVDTLAAFRANNSFTIAVCGGQTLRWNNIIPNAAGGPNLRGAGSNKAVGAPQNVNMCWTITGGTTDAWAYSVLAIKPQGLAVLDWREQTN